jgi:hypothetical protein
MSCTDQPIYKNDKPVIAWTVKNPTTLAAENATSQAVTFYKPDGTSAAYVGTPTNLATGSYEIRDYPADIAGAWQVHIASTMSSGSKGSAVVEFYVNELPS